MPAKVFIPQAQIDVWVTIDKVDLVGETMTFRRSGLSLRVVPAYFFEHVSAGLDESHKLLGRVKTKAAVGALGAEVYMSSVIVAETAYDVQVGFIGKPIDSSCTTQALVDAIADPES